MIPFGCLGYFVLKLPSEHCIGSSPLPPDSCIIIALINSTYSPIPYWFAYCRISGSYASTSALTEETVLELSPPVMQRNPPNKMTIINITTAIQPPAVNPLNNAFIASINAFIACVTAFAVVFTAIFVFCAVCLAACTAFSAFFME